MTDDEIKEAIRSWYQVQLDDLASTDELRDLLDDHDPDGGPDYARANELLSNARLRIKWGGKAHPHDVADELECQAAEIDSWREDGEPDYRTVRDHLLYRAQELRKGTP